MEDAHTGLTYITFRNILSVIRKQYGARILNFLSFGPNARLLNLHGTNQTG